MCISNFQEISEEDEKALELFMAKDAPARQTLTEIFRDKVAEKKTELDTAVSEPASFDYSKAGSCCARSLSRCSGRFEEISQWKVTQSI